MKNIKPIPIPRGKKCGANIKNSLHNVPQNLEKLCIDRLI